MARRIGWLTAVAAIALSLFRLARLVDAEGGSWQIVLVAATVLGAIVALAARAYRLRWQAALVLHLVGVTVATLRILTPATLNFGIIPGPGTLAAARTEFDYGLELVRFGASPVLAVAGLVAILAVVYWALGALAAAFLSGERPGLAAIPALVFYLQLATIDRRHAGLTWIVVFLTLAVMSLWLAAGRASRKVGVVGDVAGHALPRRSMAVALTAMLLAVGGGAFATEAFAATVPESGVLTWRTPTGLGGLYGGSSTNLFAGLQQSVLDLSDDPVFIATVSDSAPPNQDLYWQIITLDSFDGTNWLPSTQPVADGGRDRFERLDEKFQGPTIPVAARVRVMDSGGQMLPLLYSTTSLTSDEPLINDTFTVREDGAIRVDVSLRKGWEYQLTADLPSPDLGALSRTGSQLSRMFQNAADAGVWVPPPGRSTLGSDPANLTDFLDLPTSVGPSLIAPTRDIVKDATTDFERALVLEGWFRDPANGFEYSTVVSTGHSALDLTEWLFDPNSRNYRTGYCEQYATAMAVMSRAIGIPSRVVLGYTPGQVEQQSDGTEVVVVRHKNAHAWVELWMSGQGWVRFDPTPRSDGANVGFVQEELGFAPGDFLAAPDATSTSTPNASGLPDRSDPNLPELALDGDTSTGGDLGLTSGFPGWGWWLLGLVAAIGATPGIKWIGRRRRLRRMRNGDVGAAWEEIVERLADLGTEITPDQTPMELAAGIGDDLRPLAGMYTAVVCGGRPRGDADEAFAAAGALIERRYQRAERVQAWLLPRRVTRMR